MVKMSMKTKKGKGRSLLKWAEKVGWKQRVKAVCKPCWEIKYCPYGPLVEDFPLRPESTEDDGRSCRIFGHDCPVFYVAEPFTETKELRNISREIPRVTQFRVLKRENQICQICGRSVKDGDYEFDHIIPWVKGGSSDEYNVRLLCRDCNRKKGKKFEDEYLVTSVREHVIEPVEIEIVWVLTKFMGWANIVFKEIGNYPSALDVCKYWGRRKVRQDDELGAKIIADINIFFTSKKPKEINLNLFKALKYRWGFVDRKIHKVKEVSERFGITTDELLNAELSFVNRLGWQVKLTEAGKKKWLRL